MEQLRRVVEVFVHLDAHLIEIVGAYGTWTYLLLFLIVFAETGLVVTPFLPGDSLLFGAGALAASGALSLPLLLGLLAAAAILGDAVNYRVGAAVGTRVFRPDARILKTAHLERTAAFYARYGGKTLVVARFVPLVRTFAPSWRGPPGWTTSASRASTSRGRSSGSSCSSPPDGCSGMCQWCGRTSAGSCSR